MPTRSLLATTLMPLWLNILIKLKNPLDISVPTGVAQQEWWLAYRVVKRTLSVISDPFELAGAPKTIRLLVKRLTTVLLRRGYGLTFPTLFI